MPICAWLLSSLLVLQTNGGPSDPVTVCSPTASPAAPTGPIVPAAPTAPAATFPGTPSPGRTPLQHPAHQAAAADSPIPSGPTHDLPNRTVQPSTAPVTPGRATATQLVADALTLPPGNTIGGRPVSLLSVVATAPQRARQIEAVHAYWRLAEAVGDYHFALERQQRLAKLQAASDEAADLRTARAVAAADLSEAVVAVTSAQHDLAEVLLLAPSTPLPLPADPPLVGPYRTLFSTLFAGKAAPQRAKMLDQALPLRNQAIEDHAAALAAAEDVLDTALELQTAGQGRLAGVVSALDALVCQQRAFLAAVCRYNHDIADYALVVVSPQTRPEVLVGTLIKQARPSGQTALPLPTSTTVQTTYEEPISGGPTHTSPLPLPPGEGPGVRAADSSTPAVVPSGSAPNDDSQEPRLAPPQEMAIPLIPDKPATSNSGAVSPAPPRPVSPDPSATEIPSHPKPHTAQRPIGEPASAAPISALNERDSRSGQDTLSPLVGLSPAEQTTSLTATLFSARNSPAGGSDKADAPMQPLRLVDCLLPVPINDRSKAIDVYWTARQLDVLRQEYFEQIKWLQALGPTLAAQSPPSPTALLNVRAARLAVSAQEADTEADLLVARFGLAGLAGRATDKTPPQPIALPFVGRLPIEAASAAQSWSRRCLEATIPQRQQAVENQASAVVQADIARSAATADFLAGRAGIERVLAEIELQSRETSAFLTAVAEYNRVIAHYQTLVLPANIPPETLVTALRVE